MPLSSEQILDALRTVQDPDLKRDLVTLNMVKQAESRGSTVAVTIELTTPACPMKDRIRADVEQAIRAKSASAGQPVDGVDVTFTANVRTPQDQFQGRSSPLPDVRHVIAVGAGKGGVGKSTVSVNLAVGLARQGASVGLLDADIYGPSAPTLLGLEGHRVRLKTEQILLPIEVHGIKVMTIGKLVDPDKALIWRGPKAHGAFNQLAMQTEWGELDYLIVDLPPGTGDVPLSLAQLLPLSGAVIVCTPQKVAQDDARRAVRMFQQLGVEILGIVENMSYFVGDDGKTYDLFGRGGAEMMATDLSLPFLGAVPIHMDLRVNSDAGTPLRNWGNPVLAREIDHVCGEVARQVAMRAMAGKFVQPTLSIR